VTANERLARLEAQLAGADKKLDRLIALMEGTEGMVVRLDRVQEAHFRVKRWAQAAMAAGVAGFISRFVF